MGSRDLWCWRSEIRELAAIFHQNTTMLMAGWECSANSLVSKNLLDDRHAGSNVGANPAHRRRFWSFLPFANGGNPRGVLRCSLPMQGSLPGGCDAVDKIPVARIVEALETLVAHNQHNGMNRHFPDIRFIWWAGGANFTHHQDTNRLIRAWQNRSWW